MIPMALLGVTAFNALLYTGARTTSALNLSLIATSTPVFIILLARVFLREKLTTRKVLGLAAALGGVLLLITGGKPARLVLIGGEPFTEELIMWWNFLARTPEELVAMRDQWNAQSNPESQEGLDALAAYPPFPDELGGWIPAAANFSGL